MSSHMQKSDVDEMAVESISQAFSLPHFIASVLVSRGYDTKEAAAKFLNPSLDRDWNNPYEIAEMDCAINQLAKAVKKQLRIVVYGDFDLDGISATALMTRGLKHFGCEVLPFIPNRFKEGYGLSELAIERLLKLKPNLVITVDNGISAAREVDMLLAQGIEVIVTDHHEPGEDLPQGVVVIDPKCSDSESSVLAGAGVALKVIQALGSRFGEPHYWRDLIDLATLGTVADLMPMKFENRPLVREGLRMINADPRPCIAALIGQAQMTGKKLTSVNLGFSLIPRLNAAGRMGNAELALELLLCDDIGQSLILAQRLEANNDQRRTLEAELTDLAKAAADSTYHGQAALVVAGEGWHEGVKGIVASRLAKNYGVPSILFTIEGNEAHGSGRSVGRINLFKAVEACKDLLTRFGGHSSAVGITLPADKLPAFKERLEAVLAPLPKEAFLPSVEVDATLHLEELTKGNVELLDKLAPFGQENPVPKFLAEGVFILQPKAVGMEKDHLSCHLSDGAHSISAIMFRCPNIEEMLHCSCAVDAVFEVQIDHWKSYSTVKAMLSELKPLCDDEIFNRNRAVSNQGESRRISLYESGSSSHQNLEKQRLYWSEIAREQPQKLRDALLNAFLQGKSLYPLQEKALGHLWANESLMVVMGTGRGKSLIFSLYALERALRFNSCSLIVFPLRALIADQAFHLQEIAQQFGITISVLTGQSTPAERDEIFQNMLNRKVDIILTTPEFLVYHADSLALPGIIDFVAVDEVHHVATATHYFRQAYQEIGRALKQLGNPQVLALSATINRSMSETICQALGLEQILVDDSKRANLVIDDKRNIKKRDLYLGNLIAHGEKTIVYVNSRHEAIKLVETLRRLVVALAARIGFYHAGLSREERIRAEELFRSGELRVLVATSAFGEGIDIPHIRRVVLYHMPFNEIEFNQMSGRAGRDGQPAFVHLLFGRNDASINDSILSSLTPNHDDMAQIYREIRRQQQQSTQEFYPFDFDTLAKSATSLLPTFKISSRQVRSGLSVFEELGLVELRSEMQGDVERRYLHVVDFKGKVDLAQSVRYREGLDELNLFTQFKKWVLTQSASELERKIQHPLTPVEQEGGDKHGR